MLNIVTTPNPILTKKAEDVKKFDNSLKNLLHDMEEALLATNDPKGVGLAAPQAGIPLRIFMIKPSEKLPTTIFINPVIGNSSEEEGIPEFTNSEKIENSKPKDSKKKLLEGCLSIPNIWGNVSRKREVTVSFQDKDGKRQKKTFKGFAAVIIQHETDHLNGILFTKRVMEQKEKLYKSSKNAKGEDEFDEITI